MRETWYVLEGGDLGDPHEIGVGDDGVLRHLSGVAVAYGPHGPRSTGVDDAAAERAKRAKAAKAARKADAEVDARTAPAAKDREMKPKPAATNYETR